MKPVRVQWNTGRPGAHLFVCGHRCHHGMTGLIAFTLGVVLMWHDRRDFPWTHNNQDPLFRAR